MDLSLKKNKKLGITIASVIFGVGGMVHLVRLVTNIKIEVAGQEVPLCFSLVALVLAWFMFYWLWSARD